MIDSSHSEQTTEAIISAAFEAARREPRVRMRITHAVALARAEFGDVHPDHAEEDALILAQNACAILAECIFLEDGELGALRRERDHYKKLAEDALLLFPGLSLVVSAQGIVTEGEDANAASVSEAN